MSNFNSGINTGGGVFHSVSINSPQAGQSAAVGQIGIFGPRTVISIPPNNHLLGLSPPGAIRVQITNLPVQIYTTVTTTYMPTPLNPRSGQILFDRGVATLMEKGYSISEAADMANIGMQWAQTNFGYDYSLAESQFMGWINGAPHRADNVSTPDDAATALAHEGRDEEFMKDDLLTVELPPSEDDEHIYAEVPSEKEEDLSMLVSSSHAQPVSPNIRMAVLAEQEEYVQQGQQPLDQAGSAHSAPDELTSDAPVEPEYQSLVADRELLGVSSTYNDLGVAKGAFRKLLAHSSDLSWSRKIVNAAKKYLSFNVGNKALLKNPDPDQLKALGELNLDASASERSIRLALINEASNSLDKNEVTLHENRMKELDMIHDTLFGRG